jgi:hypothetical protein
MSPRGSPKDERRGGYERAAAGGGGDSPPANDNARGKESIEIERDDAAFVLGRGGATKKKIERACGAMIDLNEREYRIDVQGTKRQRKLALDYLKYVMQQRVGPVQIDMDEMRDDLTVLTVPDDCVAFVMGRAGQTLRMIEEEWCTLMFFAKMSSQGRTGEGEKLMIFGDLRARRGAELKVMSAVEHKRPGHFVKFDEAGAPAELIMGERFKGDIEPPDSVRRAPPRARLLSARPTAPSSLSTAFPPSALCAHSVACRSGRSTRSRSRTTTSRTPSARRARPAASSPRPRAPCSSTSECSRASQVRSRDRPSPSQPSRLARAARLHLFGCGGS